MSSNLTSTTEAFHYSELPPESGELAGVVKAERAFSRGEASTHVAATQLVRLALAGGGKEEPPELVDADLRARVVESDLSSTQSMDLAATWRTLLRGDRSIAASFHDQGRCYLVLRERKPGGDALNARKLRVLEHVLLGGRHKVTTHELKISASTVSMVARQALAFLGLDCTPSKVPLMLCVIAHAGRPGALRREARSSLVRTAGGELTVLSIGRPDFALRPRLSQGEFAVLTGLVEGKTHKQIALERGASSHTIANQLTSAFRRLGLSGRLELLQALATPLQASGPREPEPEPASSPRAVAAPDSEDAADSADLGSGGVRR